MTLVLPSLQFTDFHKFLVSAGGLSVAAAVGLPLVMRTQKLNLTSAKDVTALPPQTQDALELQQQQSLILLKAWPYASGFLLALGITLVLIGGISWRNRQKVINDRESAEIDKIRAEREKAYQETVAIIRSHKEDLDETAQSLEEKVIDSQSTEELSSSEAASAVGPKPRTNSSDVAVSETPDSALQKTILELDPESSATVKGMVRFIKAQQEAIHRFIDLWGGENIDIVRDVRIRGGGRADFVVTSRLDHIPGIVADIRTYSEGMSPRVASEIVSKWLRRAFETTALEYNAPLRPVSVLIFPDATPRTSMIKVLQTLNYTLRGEDGLGGMECTVILSRESDLANAKFETDWFSQRKLTIVQLSAN
ncbi:hypothetical protein AB0F72_41450 [Actinoplanes sp. NPDC023936]|uniref:hypothetical protein n=1 Tax=Actinoplanes sp. NPDC023936 TaxID=3154910 RepID=UPI0033F97728